MPERQLIIYCDESDEKGRYYSHFYGGALINASEREAISEVLNELKAELHLNGELKWQYITQNYQQKYIDFINRYFDFIESGQIKLRVMFTQNINVRKDMEEYQLDNEYFMLYYQFVKHAFGLRYCTEDADGAAVALYLDDVPQNNEKFENFRDYMSSLSDYPVFKRANVSIAREDITEIKSNEHVILQGLDIILGGVQSRLNEKHTRVVPPARRRSKRARAKDAVYRVIKDRIWGIYPNFNVGASTATHMDKNERWHHPYRHWLFKPSDSEPDRTRGKRPKK